MPQQNCQSYILPRKYLIFGKIKFQQETICISNIAIFSLHIQYQPGLPNFETTYEKDPFGLKFKSQPLSTGKLLRCYVYCEKKKKKPLCIICQQQYMHRLKTKQVDIIITFNNVVNFLNALLIICNNTFTFLPRLLIYY